MTPEQLLKRIEALEKKIAMQESAGTLPLRLDQALVGRGFLKPTSSQIASIKALSGGKTATYYVSLTSGGAVTHAITFTNGILTTS